MTIFSEWYQWLLEDKTRWLIIWISGAVLVFIFISVVSRYVEIEKKIPFYKAFTASLLWFTFMPVLCFHGIWYLLEIVYSRFTGWEVPDRRTELKININEIKWPDKK